MNGPRKYSYTKSGTTCLGCDFHKSQLVRSGRDPIYAHNCTHSEAKRNFIGGPMQGNLPENGETPTEWCPILNPKTKE